jgi:hypothetical protein
MAQQKKHGRTLYAPTTVSKIARLRTTAFLIIGCLIPVR